MNTLTIRIASAVAALLATVVVSQAAPNTYSIDQHRLPLLVDKYYEIKHPEGPVTLSPGQIEALTKVPLTERPGDFGVPMPGGQFGF